MDDKNNNTVNGNDTPVIKERKRWAFLGLPFTFTKYILDEKSLKLNKGFLTTTEDDILLFRVMDISIKRTLLQRMFGLGTMLVYSSDKTNPNLEVKNIKAKNTLPLQTYYYVQRGNWFQAAAYSGILTIPVMLVTFLLQRYLRSGYLAGSLKG
jgi:hypothetical protein